jgi:hypothetical protein
MIKIISLCLICFLGCCSFAQESVEEKIVLLNHLGYNVSNYKVNERRLAICRSNIPMPLDVLILGSSRVRKINNFFFNQKVIINSGVSGCILQDLLAIYYNYEKTGVKPKEIFIGIDPWLLNNNDKRWKVVKQDFENMKNILSSKPVNDTITTVLEECKLKDLYPDTLFKYSNKTFTETDESFSFLTSELGIEKAPKNKLKFVNKKIKDPLFYETISNNTEIELTEAGNSLVNETQEYRKGAYIFKSKYQKLNIQKLNINILTSIYGFPELYADELVITYKKQNLLNTITHNGSLVYNKDFETFNEDRIKTSLKNNKKKLYKVKKNQKMNNSNKQLFELFVEYLINNGIKVTFLLFPYHPDMYSHISSNKNYSFINTFELYVNNLAKKHNIQVLGSYNPDKSNIIGEDFYDAMHLRNSGLQKILLMDE